MDYKLTDKQELALNYMKNGKNVFLTGPAGTGKSFLLKIFIDWYKLHNILDEESYDIDNESHKSIYTTSTTGLSALLINGITIHRFAGIGIGDKDVETYYTKLIKNKNIRKRWQNTRVLIIDEISMMDSDLFDKLEELARKIRRNEEPFGNIQLILCGDFFQLPPIGNDKFCFESKNWKYIDKIFNFDEILRQNNNTLQQVLNKVRLGIVDDSVRELLDSCIGKNLIHNDNIIPTLLFSLKNKVVDYNNKELKKIIDFGKEYNEYESTYIFNKFAKDEEIYKDLINKQYYIEDKITLSIDTQVMLTVNMPDYNLANGSKGIVIGFDELKYPIIKFTNKKVIIIREYEYVLEEGKVIVKKRQLPLILAWAITIHKAQGMTLDFIKTDIGNSIFEFGQAYVVLSRIKDIEGLSLINIDYSKIKAHPKILKYYKSLL
jgi:ATP-dependent DNA helicase PIF1